MARPLTKNDKTGALYRRPPTIEVKIDVALAHDLPRLRQRGAITDPAAADYLPSESLVHLVREGKRRGDGQMMNTLLDVLLRRCEANLLAKIPDSGLPNAADLKEEVLSQFGELFAVDGSGENPDELDFFECRFNRAFRSLRIDIVRKEVAGMAPSVSLSDMPADSEETADDDKVLTRISEALRTPARQYDTLLLNELLAPVNSLPREERQAVVLCRILGYDEESDDSSKITAATLCNTTGRTIRNRLSRAAKKLSRFKEDV